MSSDKENKNSCIVPKDIVEEILSPQSSSFRFDIPKVSIPSPPEMDFDSLPGARLSRIEQNQIKEIEKLKELNEKKEKEIEGLKADAIRERKRFWITYAITTFVAIVGIVLGIIF